jgi:hypothetical protein
MRTWTRRKSTKIEEIAGNNSSPSGSEPISPRKRASLVDENNLLRAGMIVGLRTGNIREQTSVIALEESCAIVFSCIEIDKLLKARPIFQNRRKRTRRRSIKR